MMILNTLTQCLDLQGVLYTILNELSDTVLNQLLFLNKHSIREISSQYSDMRAFRTRYTHDTRHTTHDTRHTTHDTRHTTHDTRHTTHDTRSRKRM
jgi:hypothetical protein